MAVINTNFLKAKNLWPNALGFFFMLLTILKLSNPVEEFFYLSEFIFCFSNHLKNGLCAQGLLIYKMCFHPLCMHLFYYHPWRSERIDVFVLIEKCYQTCFKNSVNKIFQKDQNASDYRSISRLECKMTS